MRGNQRQLDPIAWHVAQRFFGTILVCFQDFFYFKGFVAGPAKGLDAVSCGGKAQSVGIA
jgi:hypothetical protein